jgi:putative flavoprotein involved in K+ transport
MPLTDVAILGAGQAGLSMSRCLSVLGIEHAIFERGDVAERWKTTIWDSLTTLTPNWMNGLPWQPYEGPEPSGFMHRNELIGFLQRYATRCRAPVIGRSNVILVDSQCGQYRVVTTRGTWRARAVIIATGYCDLPRVPNLSHALSPAIESLHSSQYRAPEQLTDGAVLVVGASASGIQIAEELRQAGRNIILSVGRHTRLPRRWRGHDIFWWLTRLGKLSERPAEMGDVRKTIEQPSLQLVGRSDHANVDLPWLQERGVRLAGRVRHISRDVVHFEDDLHVTASTADAKLARLLREIDTFAGVFARDQRYPVRTVDVFGRAPRSVSLRSEGIRTVIWATGFKRAYPWLKLPLTTANGELEHREGVTRAAGVYALGLRFLRKRDSNFIGGVGTDAWEIAVHLANFLGQASKTAA